LLQQALAQGQSVVVDNTNPTATDREPLIQIGHSFGATVTGYYFESNVSDCLQRNSLRVGIARVPDIALYATIKKLERPAYGEGFDHLYYVRIAPSNGFEVSEWAAEDRHE